MSAERPAERLLSLVRALDEGAAEARKLIREFADQDWHSFYSAALETLKDPADSCGRRYLIKVLIGRNLLAGALCDPVFSIEEAARLAGMAIQVDPMTGVNLANVLGGTEGASSDSATSARLMEILTRVSDSARILPSLRRLMRHPNPHVRSKAVLMIGRGDPAAPWLRNRMEEGDARVRANTIEALWGVDTEETRVLLRAATEDRNNRVAGNALFALYRLGDTAASPELLRMAEHDSPAFRATAAWVMGETADPRFALVLARMLGDGSSAVRKRAFTALGKLAAAKKASSERSSQWNIGQ